MPLPIAARPEGLSVVYTCANGTATIRTGGTRSWRNNNPGNLRHGAFTKRHGAIGEAGGFAVFPSAETGLLALTRLLQVPRYQSLTLSLAINRFAPKTENNTENYINFIIRHTNITAETQLSTLTPAQLTRLAATIQQMEGYRPGKTASYTPIPAAPLPNPAA